MGVDVMAYLQWIFWKVWYFLRPVENDLGAVMTWAMRTRKPWFKFRPNVYRNEEGRSWTVVLDDVSYYCQLGTLRCDLLIEQGSNRIVGFDIWDSELVLKEPVQ
jgi:hypothetical protein